MVGRWIFLAALVALLALVVVLVLRARDALADLIAQSGPDQRRQQALEEARERLNKAEKAHAKRVRRARKELTEAGRDPVLAKVGPVILAACTVTVRKKVHELSPTTVFRVDVEGEIRQVVTRQGGQEKPMRDDQREVFVTITDDAWADVVKLPPAQLEGARRLAAAGAAAVRNLQTAQGERDVRILTAEEDLRRVLADAGDVDAARMTLEDLEGVGPRRIDVPEPPPQQALDGQDVPDGLEMPGDADLGDEDDGPLGGREDR
ncbi:hypothetical protein [Ornithinimicrobium pratense]|uniref:Uncharacterized protein n=1 Tax=Ornithinimicrobium pratense TaxID=2593973 RepID=A0A5J6V370_9MICO|nr:hypothetical protein [Ornithinimicrobium pratense]QFG68309.1 hypothetical protein FY030_05910 [Ornithinimicrobium pratense]